MPCCGCLDSGSHLNVGSPSRARTSPSFTTELGSDHCESVRARIEFLRIHHNIHPSPPPILISIAQQNNEFDNATSPTAAAVSTPTRGAGGRLNRLRAMTSSLHDAPPPPGGGGGGLPPRPGASNNSGGNTNASSPPPPGRLSVRAEQSMTATNTKSNGVIGEGNTPHNKNVRPPLTRALREANDDDAHGIGATPPRQPRHQEEVGEGEDDQRLQQPPRQLTPLSPSNFAFDNGPLEPVILNIYHLIDEKPNNRLDKIGIGLFHTGVEVYKMEWSYGEAVSSTQVSGIFVVNPRTAMTNLKASIVCGHTRLSPEQVDTCLHRLENEWLSVDYHVTHNNCNHFADYFLQLLSCGLKDGQVMKVPKWVNRLSNGLDWIVPKRLATWAVKAVDGSPPVAVSAPVRGKIGNIPPSVVPEGWYRMAQFARAPKYSLLPHLTSGGGGGGGGGEGGGVGGQHKALDHAHGNALAHRRDFPPPSPGAFPPSPANGGREPASGAMRGFVDPSQGTSAFDSVTLRANQHHHHHNASNVTPCRPIHHPPLPQAVITSPMASNGGDVLNNNNTHRGGPSAREEAAASSSALGRGVSVITPMGVGAGSGAGKELSSTVTSAGGGGGVAASTGNDNKTLSMFESTQQPPAFSPREGNEEDGVDGGRGGDGGRFQHLPSAFGGATDTPLAPETSASSPTAAAVVMTVASSGEGGELAEPSPNANDKKNGVEVHPHHRHLLLSATAAALAESPLTSIVPPPSGQQPHHNNTDSAWLRGSEEEEGVGERKGNPSANLLAVALASNGAAAANVTHSLNDLRISTIVAAVERPRDTNSHHGHDAVDNDDDDDDDDGAGVVRGALSAASSPTLAHNGFPSSPAPTAGKAQQQLMSGSAFAIAKVVEANRKRNEKHQQKNNSNEEERGEDGAAVNPLLDAFGRRGGDDNDDDDEEEAFSDRESSIEEGAGEGKKKKADADDADDLEVRSVGEEDNENAHHHHHHHCHRDNDGSIDNRLPNAATEATRRKRNEEGEVVMNSSPSPSACVVFSSGGQGSVVVSPLDSLLLKQRGGTGLFSAPAPLPPPPPYLGPDSMCVGGSGVVVSGSVKMEERASGDAINLSIDSRDDRTYQPQSTAADPSTATRQTLALAPPPPPPPTTTNRNARRPLFAATSSPISDGLMPFSSAAAGGGGGGEEGGVHKKGEESGALNEEHLNARRESGGDANNNNKGIKNENTMYDSNRSSIVLIDGGGGGTPASTSEVNSFQRHRPVTVPPPPPPESPLPPHLATAFTAHYQHQHMLNSQMNDKSVNNNSHCNTSLPHQASTSFSVLAHYQRNANDTPPMGGSVQRKDDDDHHHHHQHHDQHDKSPSFPPAAVVLPVTAASATNSPSLNHHHRFSHDEYAKAEGEESKIMTVNDFAAAGVGATAVAVAREGRDAFGDTPSPSVPASFSLAAEGTKAPAAEVSTARSNNAMVVKTPFDDDVDGDSSASSSSRKEKRSEPSPAEPFKMNTEEEEEEEDD